jgi:hypothetical protein
MVGGECTEQRSLLDVGEQAAVRLHLLDDALFPVGERRFW